MSQISSVFGNLPGQSAVVETYEAALMWGPASSIVWWNGYIYSGAIDSGNTPTYRLRPGLVLGLITATGQWTNYSPTATDGSEIAQGILAYGLRMQDVFTGSNTNKFYAIVIGGRVKGANLIGLDNLARDQMSRRFIFDDNLLAGAVFPFYRMTSKVADYTITAADNGTEFNNAGAIGAVNFTLPTLANGLSYNFRVVADQSLTVTSAAGNDIVAYNDAAASSLAFSTGGQKVGGGLRVYSNPGATAWYSENTSMGANTVTVA